MQGCRYTGDVSKAMGNFITLGVMLGLVLGKPIGVTAGLVAGGSFRLGIPSRGCVLETYSRRGVACRNRVHDGLLYGRAVFRGRRTTHCGKAGHPDSIVVRRHYRFRDSCVHLEFEWRSAVNEPTFIFRDIAMVFAGAFIVGLLFWRLRQPLILGYVFAGLGASAHSRRVPASMTFTRSSSWLRSVSFS